MDKAIEILKNAGIDETKIKPVNLSWSPADRCVYFIDNDKFIICREYDEKSFVIRVIRRDYRGDVKEIKFGPFNETDASLFIISIADKIL